MLTGSADGTDAATAITLSARQPVRHPGLREQGEAVGHSPVLDDLAVGGAGEIEHADVDWLVAGRPEERSARGARRPPPQVTRPPRAGLATLRHGAQPAGAGAGMRPSCSSISSRSNIRLNETCRPSR